MNFSLQRILHQPITTLALLTPALILLSGCVVAERPRSHRTVFVEPAPAMAVDTMVIATAPPPPRREVIIERERPSSDHTWVGGYWNWREGRHVWIAGHWERPPQPGCTWIEPRWEHRDHGYVFVGGSWRNSGVVVNERAVVAPGVNVRLDFVVQAPPPPRREVIIERERPSAEHIWIKGYWRWHEGRHVWVAGHWEHPPHAHAVWMEPRWEHRHEGYVFIEGFWR